MNRRREFVTMQCLLESVRSRSQTFSFVILLDWISSSLLRPCPLETVQDFLIKLDIKPLMHLLEINIFSLNNVILRLTKIMNRADKNWAHF